MYQYKYKPNIFPAVYPLISDFIGLAIGYSTQDYFGDMSEPYNLLDAVVLTPVRFTQLEKLYQRQIKT